MTEKAVETSLYSVENFVTWLNLLELNENVDSETIFTGRGIAEALNKIDGDFFDMNFLNRIKPDSNWHLKKNNLHKVYLRLFEFYKERLDVELTEKCSVDFRNEDFISLLLAHSSKLQYAAINAVEEVKSLMQQSSTFDKNPEENIAVTVKELKEERDQYAEQNKTLRLDLKGLGDSSSELENLRKQLHAAHNLKENIQDSLYKVEAERDHYRKSAEEAREENAVLLKKIEFLAPLGDECRKAKDEVEEYRLRALDFEKLHSQVEVYKTKLKEYNSQKVEIKVLEEKVTTYMQSVIAYEDEQRKNGALKTQIESLRLENRDLGNKLREEAIRGDKAEFEVKRLSDKLKDVEEIKEQLREECRQLNEKVIFHEDFRQGDLVSSLHKETMEAAGVCLQFLFRERVLRLEKENEILRAKESDQIKLVKDDLNVMAEKKAEVESELKWSQRKIMELEAKLKDVEESMAEGEGLNKNRFSEQQAVKERLLLTLEQLKARLEQAQKVNEAGNEEKERLKEQLKATEEKYIAEKENLRMYMERARRVIDDVEKQNRAVEAGSLSRHEFDAIRRERDSYKETVENWEEKLEKSRTMHEEEQRLLISYLYDMMMERLRSTSNNSEVPTIPEKSFLARQRQYCYFVYELVGKIMKCLIFFAFFEGTDFYAGENR
uniref:Calponin-homology (CH) domain-containing protein n=1 Tax=Syphacia muris TaxID=451379 RepID=A0A0N5AZG2_9BILA